MIITFDKAKFCLYPESRNLPAKPLETTVKSEPEFKRATAFTDFFPWEAVTGSNRILVIWLTAPSENLLIYLFLVPFLFLVGYGIASYIHLHSFDKQFRHNFCFIFFFYFRFYWFILELVAFH